MKFFNHSLRHRLLLATIPSFVLLIALVADVLIDGGYLGSEGWIFLWIAYAALFGGFVMAPFITSPSRVILRIGVLIAASILIPYAMGLSYEWLENEYDAPLGIANFLAAIPDEFISSIIVILLGLLLAAVLVIAAPLKVFRKYWIYIALAALVTTGDVVVR